MSNKKTARQAALQAAAALKTGETTIGGTDAEGSAPEGGGAPEGGSADTSSDAPAPVVAGTGTSQPPQAQTPTATAASAASGGSTGKSKKDIFGNDALATAVGLRKALWSTKGPVHIPLKSNGIVHNVEVVKASIINILNAAIEKGGESAAAPWIFTHRKDSSGGVVGCLLSDPAAVQTVMTAADKAVITADEPKGEAAEEGAATPTEATAG